MNKITCLMIGKNGNILPRIIFCTLNRTTFNFFPYRKMPWKEISWNERLVHFLLLVTLIPWLAINCANADEQPLESMYISIKPSSCSKPPPKVAAIYDANGLSAQECPAHKGWQLFVVSSDERSWIDIAHGNKLWTTEEEVVYNNEFGYFPNIGAEQVEWRKTKSGLLVSLIFRISAQDPNRPASGPVARTLSRLFVIGLSNGVPRFCGIAKTNEAARDMADNAIKCTATLKERALN